MPAAKDVSSYWSDDGNYVPKLERERTLYAWCLVHYGGDSYEVAHAASEKFYAYEPPGKSYRGLVFHKEAWAWAMLHKFDDGYWISRPELLRSCDDYRRLEASMDSTHAS